MSCALTRSGHPLLAAVLTVGISGTALAQPPPQRPDPAPIGVSEELELLKEEETVSIASRYEQPISEAPSTFLPCCAGFQGLR